MANPNTLPQLPQFDIAKYVSPSAEPSRFIGLLCALVIIGFIGLSQMGIGYDPNLPNTAIAFLMTIGAIYPFIQANLTRRVVTPTAKAEDAVKAAYEAGRSGDPEPTFMEAAETARASTP